MRFIENTPVPADHIANLRQAVGWNRMESSYRDPRLLSYFHVACYDHEKLIGYIDTVSNNVADAYIQDLMVHPNHQSRGIGTELMNRVIAKLKADRIYMISVIYDEKLQPFYQRFGFFEMRAGQLQTRHEP